MNTVSICIATYRRCERLGALLDDLAAQHHLPDEVIVVDNDPAASASSTIEACRQRAVSFPIHYTVQPKKNIALTRNRTVELASGDWLAFIDDDERAPPAWLERLIEAAKRYEADGVLGPVEPIVPATAPAWIRRGRFYDFPRMATGHVIPPNRLRFGNVLLKSSWLAEAADRFDTALGVTGGEDGDLLARLTLKGARLVWCDDAVVHEPVEASRLTLRWLLLRALRGGQDFARHTLAGRYGPVDWRRRGGFFVVALLQTVIAAGLALLSWPAGLHRAARWLTAMSANLGKLSVFFGAHYREYA